MKSVTLGKNMNTKKEGRQAMKMKKIITMVIVTMMMGLFTTQGFAYSVYDYNNYNSNYNYNNGYNNNYNYNYNYNYTTYSYGPYQYHVDSYVESGMRNNYDVTSKYYSGTATRYEAVKHYMAFYNNNTYISNYNYNYNYGYGYNTLQQFADYNSVVSSYSSEDLQIMQQAVQIGLLRGIEENGYTYLAPSNNLRRCEYAAFTNRAMNLMGISIYGNYQVNNFQDVPYSHWAYQDIFTLAAKGIMSGYSSYSFGVDDTFKSQDALLTYYRIFCEESGRFNTETFKNVINNVGYFWLEDSTSYGSYFELEELGTLNVGDSYRVKVSTDVSGYSATAATWTSSNRSVATVNSYGQVTAKSAGTAKITCTYGGYSDSIYVTVVGSGYSGDYDYDYDDSLAFNESVITVEKGSTENLYSHLVTKYSDVTFSTNYTQYFTISGNTLYANQTTKGVGYEVIARRTSTSETATIKVIVTDNNPVVPSNINPSIEWGDNNTVNTVYFTIRGIDSSCEVQLNANSGYKLLSPTASGSTWATYYVDGSTMEAVGGTTTLVVRVIRNGEPIWESDPKSFYYGD